MNDNAKPDNNSSHAIDLDSDQLKELEKLIDGLKKEIVLPVKNGKARAESLQLANK